jgi:hypothetical protein
MALSLGDFSYPVIIGPIISGSQISAGEPEKVILEALT